MSLVVEELILLRADGVTLLGPLSLTLATGVRPGLAGESGSGKCLLARALFGDPEWLVLDEPTTALDPLVQRDFLDLMLDF